MSYVLEALKKREAEENPDAAVALSLGAQRERRHRMLAALLWAALILNLVVLAGLLLWPGLPLNTWFGGGPGAGHSEAAASGPAASGAAPADTPVQPAASQLASPAASPAPAAAAAQPAMPAAGPGAFATSKTLDVPALRPARPPRPAYPIAMDQLPTAVRERLPGIVFSTHIYAEDRDLRAVIANGQRLSEGDQLGAVVVSEITETGVILAFDGYLISVPVVGFWDAP